VNLSAADEMEIGARTQFAQSFFIHLIDGRMGDSAVKSRINTKKD